MPEDRGLSPQGAAKRAERTEQVGEALLASAGILCKAFWALVYPPERLSLGEMVRFRIDYPFWLNIAVALVGAVLLYLHFRRSLPVRTPRGENAADTRSGPA